MTEAVVKAQRWMSSPRVTLTIQIIAVVSLIVGLFVGIGQYKLAGCLARYNDAYSAVATQRADAAAATNDAVDKFIRAVVASTQAGPLAARQAAFQRAYEDYITSRAAADEQRKLSPLPEPPKDTC